MEENTNIAPIPDSSQGNRLMDSNTDDDAEDFIPPSQPQSFQGTNFGSVGKKESGGDYSSEAFTCIIDETQPVTQSTVSSPPKDAGKDVASSSEALPKCKISELEMDLEDSSKERFGLDDASVIKDTQNTQSELNDTIDAAKVKITESPSTLETQPISSAPESPRRVGEVLEGESREVDSSDDGKIKMSEDTSAEDSTFVSTEVIQLDNSDVEKNELSVCEIPDESKMNEKSDTVEIVEDADPSPRFTDSSEVMSTLVARGENEPNLPKEEEETDSTPEKPDGSIDVNDISCPSVVPNSSEKTDPQLSPLSVPSVTQGLSSSLIEHDSQSMPIDDKAIEERLKLKSVLKNISDEEMARLQKHSTPENPLTKSLKINESTSSIENGTPPIQEDKVKEIAFNVMLQVNCQVVMDPLTKKSISKKILNVKEIQKKQQKQNLGDPSPGSFFKVKGLSSSSSGSVYSDNVALPFALSGRTIASAATDGSSGSSVDLAKHIQINSRQVWSNEYMIPMAIDEIMPRFIEQSLTEEEKSDNNSNRKRTSSIRVRKKTHWNRPLDNVLESSLTEPSSSNASDAQQPSLEKSDSARFLESTSREGSNSEPENESHSEEVKREEGKSENVEEMDIDEENVGSDNDAERNESEEDILSEGLTVFARWTDKRYYPGTLKNRAKYDRWEVKFDDDTEKVIRDDLILPIKWLTKGELVFALVEEKYLSGKILNIIRGEEMKFSIELDEKEEPVTIDKSDLCLNDIMAGIIREKYKNANRTGNPAKPSSEIDFDNVVVGKRVREQRTPSRSTAAQIPATSTTKKKKMGVKSGDVIVDEKRTPKARTTPVEKRDESVPEKFRSSKRKTKLELPPEDQETDENKMEFGSMVKETQFRSVNKPEGAKRRARALNYDSEKVSGSAQKKRRLSEDSAEATTAKSQKKMKGSARASGNDPETTDEEASERRKGKGIEARSKAHKQHVSAGTYRSKESLQVKGKKTSAASVDTRKRRKNS